MGILDDLATKYGTDKGMGHHNYCHIYEKYFSDIRFRKMNILEIGVLEGASMRMWNEYFPKSQIIGIDINPDCKKNELSNIKIETGSQTDYTFLKSVIDKYRNFDIIIDDGGHSWHQQIFSFETLYPYLNSKGVYIVEDLHTSYEPGISNYDDTLIPPVEYFKRLIDHVNYMYNRKILPNLRIYEDNIETMLFYRYLLIIQNK